MTLPAGTRLGTFEILAPIGAGGMGEVFQATDTKLNREVALKVLPETVAQDAERMARFQREAQMPSAGSPAQQEGQLKLAPTGVVHALVADGGLAHEARGPAKAGPYGCRARAGDGAGGRADAGGAHRGQPGAHRRSAAHRAADCGGPGIRARARDHPPGPETRQHQADSRGAEEPLLFYGSRGKIMAVRYRAPGSSFQHDKPEVWSPGEVMSLGGARTHDLAPDGKRFAVLRQPEGTTAEQAQPPLTFVLNFFDEVRRKVSAGKN